MGRTPPVVHSDGYYADIGLHVFPMRKFRLVREEIVRRGLLHDSAILAPEPATEEAVLELPYSKGLVTASFLCAGGSILAARRSLDSGVGINLAGGFHHAFPD